MAAGKYAYALHHGSFVWGQFMERRLSRKRVRSTISIPSVFRGTKKHVLLHTNLPTAVPYEEK